jgi:prepilin-type N-terminal cleavage/methylation domain-containing protein
LNLTQPKRQWSGFTLIELMICLSLIATLSTLLAPRLLETVPELVLERQARQLQSLLSNARTLALVHDSSTIVCPASTASIRPLNAENALAGDWCDPHGNWQTGVNVVLDRNQNRSIDAADNLVFHLAWYTSRGLPPQIQ